MVLVILDAIFIPMQASFDMDPMGQPWIYFTMCWFLSDIVLNFFTGYLKDHVLVLKQKDIVRNYITSPWPSGFPPCSSELASP
jgi:hypothetical protein